MSQSRIIVGFHAVLSRIRQHPQSIKEICVDKDRIDPRMKSILIMAEEKKLRVMQLNRERLDGMAGNARHQGVIAHISNDPLPYVDIHEVLETLNEPPFLLVLDRIEDPHNLGACLRVADAMGVHAVIAPKDNAVGINATVRKVACGAAENIPYIVVTNLARTLREIKAMGIWLVGAAAESDNDLFTARFEGGIAMVLGAEGRGLRRLTSETCDQLIRIPMNGSVESLNVSVACGIFLYEARRQRHLSGLNKP